MRWKDFLTWLPHWLLLGSLWWIPPGSHLLHSSLTLLENMYSISEKVSATYVLNYLGSWEMCFSNILLEGYIEKPPLLDCAIPMDTFPTEGHSNSCLLLKWSSTMACLCQVSTMWNQESWHSCCLSLTEAISRDKDLIFMDTLFRCQWSGKTVGYVP